MLISRNRSSSTSSHSPLVTLVVLFSLFLVGGVTVPALVSYSKQTNNPSVSATKPSPEPKANSPLLIYGNWKSGKSYINAFDLNSNKIYSMAILPLNIKHVRVLPSGHLIYIAKTDPNTDRGGEIDLFSLKDKTATTLFRADSGFGIDDYRVSPGGKYVVDWEAKNASFKGAQLSGGKSKSYSVILNQPKKKYLLYDEPATTCVHYPVAVTDAGKIFFDCFIPGVTTGWAAGMTVSDLKGTKIQEITSMKNGTYGTPPFLLPDQKHLAFIGYDGANGTMTHPWRRAITYRNTLETLDTATLERTKIPFNNHKGFANIIQGLSSDKNTGNLLITETNIAFHSDFTYYNLTARSETAIPFSPNKFGIAKPITAFGPNNILGITFELQKAGLGNLGENYNFFAKEFSILSLKNNKETPLPLSDINMQYITMLPAGYLPLSALSQLSEKSKQTIQVDNFDLKPQLAAQRLNQQSGVTNDYGCDHFGEVTDVWCWDSPLYVYGRPGQKITVTVNTPLFFSTAPYQSGYAISVGNNNDIVIDGKTYPSVSYAFRPAKVLPPPTRGIVTTRENLAATLKDLASKLGLTGKETTDLIEYGQSRVVSPFIFVSFFDEKSSREILPLSFFPQPDTYQNIVFYFKQLAQKPLLLPEAPVFPIIPSRQGLTVVEISGVWNN